MRIKSMTNKEKAKELAGQLLADDQNQQPLIDVLLQMARWKDEQFNEEKKELLGLVKMLKVDEHNQTIIEDLVAMLNL